MSNLAELRDRVDDLDQAIIDLLAERMELSKEIGTLKMQNNMTILQGSRWEELLKTRLRLGRSRGLSDAFITEFYRSIHQESIKCQRLVMNKEQK